MNADYFRTLARYNVWANRRLYDACGALSPEVYSQKRPSYFGSIHNTLNHILVADRIWLGRLQQAPGGPTRLDQMLTRDFAELKSARAAEDERILKFTAGLTDDRVMEVFHYADLKGNPHARPMSLCLAHVFNHQAHHRGQVHGMLSQEMVEPPPLDIIYFLPEDAAGTQG
jgi:uncharacterized damage-inducible protein DinB